MRKYIAYFNYFTKNHAIATADVEFDLHSDGYYWVSNVQFVSGYKQAFNNIKDIRLTKIDSYAFVDTYDEAVAHLHSVTQTMIEKFERNIAKMKKIQKGFQRCGH